MMALRAVLEKLCSVEILSDLAEILEELRKSYADLGRMGDIAIISCGGSPIEYARRREKRNIISEMLRGLSARYRAKLYCIRFSPCCHEAGGVMIWKKGRIVRRKR